MSAQDELRVLLAVGDRALERRLQQELASAGLAVCGRCLDGPSLLERAAGTGVDVVLASAGLHRLSDGVLQALSERGLPLVLLAGGSPGAARLPGPGRVLPASAPGAIVAAALRQAASAGARPPAPAPGGAGAPDAEAPPAALPAGAPAGPADAAHAPPPRARGGRVLAVASGKGAPGKTTIAISVAALLAERGPGVVLLDADLRGGNVAPYLDLDPRRGLVGLAAAGGRLDSELQPGPGFRVLAGVERPELAAGLREEALRSVVEALRGRFETVVADLGVPPAAEVLRAADELLLVTGADLVSIWNARTALPGVRERAGRATCHAVLNRREGREHYDAGEVGRALGLPVLGVVREEREAARRAVARQIPLPAAGGRVTEDLRALAAALSVPDAAAPEQAPLEPEWLAFGLAGRS
ncbi:MAG: P-loop NTPase [Chloroflexi bacterium]|nr:P-loop NTPase [Chloroflexota bacterium]